MSIPSQFALNFSIVSIFLVLTQRNYGSHFLERLCFPPSNLGNSSVGNQFRKWQLCLLHQIRDSSKVPKGSVSDFDSCHFFTTNSPSLHAGLHAPTSHLKLLHS